MNSIGIEKIKKILPHAYPFLFIDRVVDYVEKESITAIKNVTYNEWFFPGHFPRLTILPGVIIQECMAQAAAILASVSETVQGDKLYLFNSCKINYFNIVEPGNQMIIKLEVVKLISSGGIFKGKVTVEDKKIATAELGFSIKNRSDMGFEG